MYADCKALRQGLYELRIDWGPGYRVYYAMIGRECVLLLCGGDKRKQAADIEPALEYLKDYKERGNRAKLAAPGLDRYTGIRIMV